MPLIEEEKNIIRLVEKTSPAVVNIVISAKEIEELEMVSPFQIRKRTRKLPKEIVVGGGSGFFVSKDGIVLTNRHVVADKKAKYTVITSDDKKYPARVLARDSINDIAILKIDAKNLPHLELGYSNSLKPGQTVIAIGNALSQFHNSISKGIISGLLRMVSAGNMMDGGIQNLRGLIQTDAAINPGNSGGPLVTTDGKVIGINAVVVFGAQNIGFAIPISNAKKDLDDLRKFGKIVQPFLGVRYVMVNKELMDRYKLPVENGAWVLKEHLPGDYAISPGSPAYKAGIKENDIITEFNGEKISNDVALDQLIQARNVGDKVKIKLLRNKKEMSVAVVLGERS